MENNLNKKYGFITAVSLVVGIVIGSGVFFKAEAVLKATGGNIPVGVAAWLIVGLLMIICSYSFATMASKYEHVNGIIDYAEATVGKKYGYFIGWFMAMIYLPTLTSVLAWVSARYTCVLIGWDITGGQCMVISCFYLVGSYALNALSPILAGKFHVTSTAIKLVPLILMAIIGTILGLANGTIAQNFSHVVDSSVGVGQGLFASIVAVAFAYEGWIVATSVNAELKDSKKNLPKALVTGSLLVVTVYILYYIGLTGAVSTELLMESGQNAAKIAFTNILGNVGGTLIFVVVVISCLGTLNGLMLGACRSMYALAVRGSGPAPEVFKQVDRVTNMPTNSSIFAVLLCGFWLLYFYGANLTDSWFGPFSFDTSELPIITLYGMYIPIFIKFMKTAQDMSVFKRLVMPALSVISCVFMVVSAWFAHGEKVLYYLIIFAAIMFVSLFFTEERNQKRLKG